MDFQCPLSKLPEIVAKCLRALIGGVRTANKQKHEATLGWLKLLMVRPSQVGLRPKTGGQKDH